MVKVYLSELTVGSSKWAGPEFRAASWEQAQRYAAEYPMPGLEIVGMKCLAISMGGHVTDYHFDERDRVTPEDVERFLRAHRAEHGIAPRPESGPPPAVKFPVSFIDDRPIISYVDA